MLAILLLLLTLGATASAQTPEERFFDWTDLPFPAAEYAARRDRMFETLGGSVFLAWSGEGRSDGGTFRVLDDFNYFVGLELPNSVLVLDGGQNATTLFVPARDARFETASRPNDFPGRPLGNDPELRRRLELSDIRPADGLQSFLSTLKADGRRLYVNLGRDGTIPSVGPTIDRNWTHDEQFVAYLQTQLGETALINAFRHIATLRMVKSPREVEAIRRAATVTAEGIRVAARFVTPGVDERTLEGEFEAEIKRRGAPRLAFASIIKSGPNSLWPWRVLASHYDRRNRAMVAGDLVIFDVGAEVDYYSSDVGRTFPVSGTFTDQQREILTMEVAVADAIIAAVRPGVTLRELQLIGEAAIPPEHRQYMQTGLFFGHHIGLAVGDPSLADAELKAGMIFTVEPWYYNHDMGIAVFTEDDILVTETGVENLTAGLPRRPDELERMVGR
jgi:Xaa-Pro aminopeptidase